jgi:hypothetical protein
VERHAGLQAETVGARYGFHRAGTDVRLLELLQLLELLELLICYWLCAKRHLPEFPRFLPRHLSFLCECV